MCGRGHGMDSSPWKEATLKLMVSRASILCGACLSGTRPRLSLSPSRTSSRQPRLPAATISVAREVVTLNPDEDLIAVFGLRARHSF